MSFLYAAILAAGFGTRMKSSTPKVLHKICGRTMLEHLVCNLEKTKKIEDIFMVVGYKEDEVKKVIGKKVTYVSQEKQLGTGHAVMQLFDVLKGKAGNLLVLNGDVPLYRSTTLESIILKHLQQQATATLVTATLENPYGYGRVVFQDSKIQGIVEEKDADEEIKKIKTINTGTYVFALPELFDYLSNLTNDNKGKEYYLTDVIGKMVAKNKKVVVYELEDKEEALGVNDSLQLALVTKIMRERILQKHMLKGVRIVDPGNTYIDVDVVIGKDTVIEPFTILKGSTSIGSCCTIGPNVELEDVTLEDFVTIKHSVAKNSFCKQGSVIGPFSYLREEVVVGEENKIGCFVDLKKTTLGKNTKVTHLAYLGDADVGDNVNFGCGAVTVNFNGVEKNRTIIKNNAFIGCNSNLIAPVLIDENAYVAAGSTITEDVPKNSLAIARKKQLVKVDYVKKLIAKFKSKKS